MQVLRHGLTVTAADLKLPISDRAAKGRAEISVSSGTARVVILHLQQLATLVWATMLGKAILTPEGAQKILKKMAEREFPSAYTAAAKKGEKINRLPMQLHHPVPAVFWVRYLAPGTPGSTCPRMTAEGGAEAARQPQRQSQPTSAVILIGGLRERRQRRWADASDIVGYVSKMKPVILRTKTAKGLLQDWGAWTAWSRQGMSDMVILRSTSLRHLQSSSCGRGVTMMRRL